MAILRCILAQTVRFLLSQNCAASMPQYFVCPYIGNFISCTVQARIINFKLEIDGSKDFYLICSLSKQTLSAV